jgi:tRNA(Ile)-lysidine synthase
VSQFQTSAQLFSKHNETLDFFIQNSISQLDIDCDSDFVILDKKSLGKFPLLAQSMIIRHLAQNNEIMWRKHHWVDLELFLSKDKTGAILNLPNGAQILDNRLQLKIRIKKHIALNAIDISLGEKVDNKSFSVQIKPLETIPVKKHNSNLEFIDAKAIKGKALKIRPWIFGDRFQPLGMMGTQKMSDFLGKRKVDQFEKETQCVMTADDNIIWVCGRQISHKARIKSSTKKAVSLQFNWK